MSTNRLSQYRAEHQVSLGDLAKACGVNKSTVSRWESRRVPVERVSQLEAVTGIPKAELRPDIFGASNT